MYRSLRAFEGQNLVVPVVGDFAGPKAIRAVGDYLEQRDADRHCILHVERRGVSLHRRRATTSFIGISDAADRFDEPFIRSLPAGAGVPVVPPGFLPNLINLRIQVFDSAGVRVATAIGSDSSGTLVTTRVVTPLSAPTTANTSAFVSGIAPIHRVLDAYTTGQLKTYGQVSAMTKTEEWSKPQP